RTGLSKAEKKRREELELVVDNGALEFTVLASAIQEAHARIGEPGLHKAANVLQALTELSRKRLYRTTHPDFPAYLRSRWPAISKSRAFQLISAVEVAVNLSTVVELPQPQNERQVRPIAGEEP